MTIQELKAELRRRAALATKGEWRAGNAFHRALVNKHQILVDTDDGVYVILEGNRYFLEDSEANIAFVEAANPQNIEALLEHVAGLEERVINLRGALRHLHHNAKASGAELGLALEVAEAALAEQGEKV